MIYQIPTFTAVPDFQEVVRLDGADYRIRFSWYERQGWWLASVWREPTGTDGQRALITGVAVRPGQDLLRFADRQYCPPGRLVVIDSDPGAGEDTLTREMLGTRLLPLYIDRASVAELATASTDPFEAASVAAWP